MTTKTKKVIVEDTEAAQSLHPAARAIPRDPKTKVEYMNATIGALASMSTDELTKWYEQSIATIGHEADGVTANSDDNQATVNAKPSGASTGAVPKVKYGMPTLAGITPGQQAVKEDVQAMFEGEELTEDFKEKVSTLFEAALTLRMNTETIRLEEEFEEAYTAALDEEISELEESLVEKVDAYLDSIVENWLEENSVAIESTLRSEIAEDFINSLKTLFVEHNINVPVEEVDMVESLTAKVKELETALDETILENSELKEIANGATRKSILESFAEGLTLNESEKLYALAEGLQFDGDVDAFAKKVKHIKEAYFKKTNTVKESNITEETFVIENENTNTTSIDPEIERYVRAMTNTVGKF